MSHIARIFISVPLQDGAPASLDDAQAKYLTRVMRLGEEATVRVFNGEDGEWICSLQVSGKKVAVVPVRQTRQQVQSLNLTLFFAPLKKTRTDFIIEKATELGVRSICPVFTEYTQATRTRADRMRLLAIEAA
ncbi:MAG: RsmE family RNA methyltransferase, partial [Pseudomonadota bacterium]